MRTKLTCEACGDNFLPKSGHLKQRTCSRKCGFKIRKNGKSGKQYPHLQRARVAQCVKCNKTFRAIKDWKDHKQKYCSKLCWSKRRSPEKKKCIHCGKDFETYERKTKIYCTSACQTQNYKERFKGANSHLWKGGRTKANKLLRSRAAYKEWRTAVFKRDSYTCQKCSRNKTYLQAHHKKPIKSYPELIYYVNNGLTLCVDCHQKEHPDLKLNIKRNEYGF